MDRSSTFSRPLGQHPEPPTRTRAYHFAERARAISIEDAFEITLEEYFAWHLKRTVISTYELAAEFVTMVYCWNWDAHNLWQGRLLRLNRRELHKLRQCLIDRSVLYQITGVNGMFLAFKPDVEHLEFVSQGDPFGCFAFGTAMYHQGLIDREPTNIFTKTPPRSVWRQLAAEEMRERGLPLNDLPTMHEPGPAVLREFSWVRVRDVQLARAPSDIGQSFTSRAETFIDLTREPAKCGGWPSVINAFRRCDRMDVSMIIGRLNRKGTLVDKARVGFLLERLGVVERAPDDWVDALHRGGSMRLDASAPFMPTNCQRWKLSVNVSELL